MEIYNWAHLSELISITSAEENRVRFCLYATVLFEGQLTNMQSTMRLEVTYLHTSSLKPDPRNPRVHSDRQLARSLKAQSHLNLTSRF